MDFCLLCSYQWYRTSRQNKKQKLWLEGEYVSALPMSLRTATVCQDLIHTHLCLFIIMLKVFLSLSLEVGADVHMLIWRQKIQGGQFLKLHLNLFPASVGFIFYFRCAHSMFKNLLKGQHRHGDLILLFFLLQSSHSWRQGGDKILIEWGGVFFFFFSFAPFSWLNPTNQPQNCLNRNKKRYR